MMPSFNDPDEQQSVLLIRMAGLIARERLGELGEAELSGGELTDAERAELNGWLGEREEHRLWADRLSPEDLSLLMEEYRSYEAEVGESLEAFHERHFGVVPMPRKSRLAWWAAAAVAMPLIVAGVWLSGRRKGEPVIAKNNAAVIQPGRNTATLTLGNGSHVLLDTGMTGQVLQKGAVLARYEGGKVAYDAKSPGDKSIEYNTLATARGGQYQLVLPDGTKVWLNAASSVRYPTVFSGKERRVELTGEGYFEVMDRKDQPFVVAVDGMDVKVLGTEFNVMAYPEEGSKKTTLVQGAVKVVNGNEERVLKPDEQSVVTKDGGLTVATGVDIEPVIAWKQGFFQFKHTDLKTIMRQIERWYDVEVVYRREDLSGEYGGRISRKLNLSELISLLEGNGVGHFKMDGRKLIVLP
jgi:ferric-dicitrate binding protein FerR (iron transport regulator)